MGHEAAHVCFYDAAGEAPPIGARANLDLDGLFAWHAGLPVAERDELDRRWGFSVTELLAQMQDANLDAQPVGHPGATRGGRAYALRRHGTPTQR